MMKKAVLILLIPVSFFAFSFLQTGNVFTCNSGLVKFVSKAPLETIKAESKKLSGALDVEKKTFAFTIPVSSFEGFNSPLQKEHFNENYMESEKLPKAVFKGKIIEDVDLKKQGVYNVRAKGTMTIHGVEKEMILKSKIAVGAVQVNVESSFTIPLKEFNIKIPNIVNQKIAQEILVDVKMDMNPKK